jgi:hypothetical protein
MRRPTRDSLDDRRDAALRGARQPALIETDNARQPITDFAAIGRKVEFAVDVQRLYACGPVALHAFLDRLGGSLITRTELERQIVEFLGAPVR